PEAEGTKSMEEDLEQAGVNKSLIEVMRKTHEKAQSLEKFFTEGGYAQDLALKELVPSLKPGDKADKADEADNTSTGENDATNKGKPRNTKHGGDSNSAEPVWETKVSRIGLLSLRQRKLWLSELRIEVPPDEMLPGPRRP